MAEFIGNQQAVLWLKTAFRGRWVPHAIVLSGSAHIGKRTLALRQAQVLLGVDTFQRPHPDFLFLEADSGEGRPVVTIAQARELRTFLSSTPLASGGKIAVVSGMEYATHEAANALLKTLEEPPERSTLFLIAESEHALLPTIRSRAALLRLFPILEQELRDGLRELGYSQSDIDVIIPLAQGRPGRAITLLSDRAARKDAEECFAQPARLLAASPFERLSFTARFTKGQKRRDIPLEWFFALRRVMLEGRDADSARSFAAFLRSLMRADHALSQNLNYALVLENALLSHES